MTYKVTYLVSPDAVVGTYLSTGASVGISTFGTDQNVDGVFVKIRDKNTGEAVTSGAGRLHRRHHQRSPGQRQLIY